MLYSFCVAQRYPTLFNVTQHFYADRSTLTIAYSNSLYNYEWSGAKRSLAERSEVLFECQGLEEVESRPAGRPAVRKSRRLLWLSYGTDRPNVFTVF